ncbi:histidine phosphatase family protein [Streptococcus cuniculipharyngis]|uniref:Histidine phosphatase family protein n=1 Tax=Streptococcus cuniculipharyngis TaxID=1562651 RepID=A0A5C5SB00_9STRE|nr:histidine phosphatase family protein [Streptococcus cuniculipharyngis]TWS98057.1 histidine phosphatase family protein [Streptococcus cuniculipharyngis]
MKLYFVRHGETLWNRQGMFQGASIDASLLEDSLPEIIQLGQALKNIPFNRIFSSDLRRAVETAQLINQENLHPKKIEEIPQLREWRLGSLEGQKISLMKAIYPKQIHAFTHNLACFNHDMFDAESVYQVSHRIADFVKSLDYQQLDHVLIVGHGASLVAGMGELLGYSPARLRQHGGLANASLSVLETTNGQDFSLLSWNDKSYLDETEPLAVVQQV